MYLATCPPQRSTTSAQRVLIGADHSAHVLGIEPRRELGRADQIAEQHRQLPPLGFEGLGVARGAYGCRADQTASRPRAERAAIAFESFRAVPERDAEFLEILVRQFGQDLGLDLVVLERLRVALQPQLPQPSRDVHKRPSWGW